MLPVIPVSSTGIQRTLSQKPARVPAALSMVSDSHVLRLFLCLLCHETMYRMRTYVLHYK